MHEELGGEERASIQTRSWELQGEIWGSRGRLMTAVLVIKLSQNSQGFCSSNLRMVHNLKLINYLLLEFAIQYFWTVGNLNHR